MLSPWMAADEATVSHVLPHVVWWKKKKKKKNFIYIYIYMKCGYLKHDISWDVLVVLEIFLSFHNLISWLILIEITDVKF